MAIVTITRQAGSGGDDIGKSIAEKLGYVYVGKERTFQELEKRGKKWLDWGKNMDEHCPNLWEHYDPSFTGFVSLVEENIFHYAMKDKVILVGRGAHWLLRDVLHALRILIIAPLEARVKRVSDHEHVNLETAARLVEFSDHERSCYVHAVYRRNWTNPDDYDVVFDTGHLSYEEVTRMILEEIPERDKQAGPETRENLARLALAAKVKAEIATDLRFFVPTLEVVHDGQMVVVRGIVHSAREHKMVEEIARQAAVPVKVRCDLHYRAR
jgi:cytidylate kinase